jgi:carbamoyl-phosphate synthase large subunit
MAKRLLVTEAGTGASEYLIRSLRAGGDEFVIVGCHWDQFFLRNSSADRRWMVPTPSDSGYAAAVSRVVERERIDFILPNADESVAALSAARRRFPGLLLLPRHKVVRLCQDKYALNKFLSRRNVPVPETRAVRHLAGVETVFRNLESHSPLWCRIRSGSNSRGAAPVATSEQARSWIRYWSEMRAVPPRDFTLAEYLPGRDFACLMLWNAGTLVLAKTCERLSYFFASSQPSGQSSMAGLSKTVHEPRLVETCTRAIRALDARASGVFSIDLKSDERGEARITEINAGRLIAQTILLDRAGKHNLTLTYARLALGEPVTLRDEYEAAADHYFVRNVDAEPLLFHASEFFQGIEDARTAERATDRRHAGRRTPRRPPEAVAARSRTRFKISGSFDRHALEALSLELRRVGLTMGFRVTAFEVNSTG